MRNFQHILRNNRHLFFGRTPNLKSLQKMFPRIGFGQLLRLFRLNLPNSVTFPKDVKVSDATCRPNSASSLQCRMTCTMTLEFSYLSAIVSASVFSNSTLIVALRELKNFRIVLNPAEDKHSTDLLLIIRSLNFKPYYCRINSAR